MKNLINYLYHIDIDSIEKCKKYYLLKDKETVYLFSKYEGNRDFVQIYNTCNELNYHYFYTFKLKNNIYNQILTTIDNEVYYLLDIGLDYEDEVDFYDMLNFYKRSFNLLGNRFQYNFNWDILWENKINYLQLHANNNNVTNIKIMPLFYYYLGLAENALIYVKTITKSYIRSIDDKISFTHRRVNFPVKRINFYNPLNLIIDLEVRDIAEYIKSLYYSDLDYLDDLEYYLKTSRLTRYSASLLYARIVYPSNFFDYFEDQTNTYFSDKYYDPNAYENFIKKTYELINSYVNIDKILWL